jgi:Fe-S cluster assembly iron-binding protein IscA
MVCPIDERRPEMLTLTDSAKDAVREMVAAEDAPEGSGLRIAAEEGTDGDAALSLEIAAAPAEGDAVVDEDGARIFLEPTAASLLEDMVLDVEPHGDHVHFTLDAQTSPGANGNGPA